MLATAYRKLITIFYGWDRVETLFCPGLITEKTQKLLFKDAGKT